MDQSEARALLATHLASYRRQSYGELVALIGNPRVAEIAGPSGVPYQIEVEVRWDSPSERTDVRVLGGIDDGRFSGALSPVSDSFIRSPG
jgi:hypothetical protein